MKLRVIESSDGRFYPQFAGGWLSALFGFWKFFQRGADTSQSMLLLWIQTEDPMQAAHFATAEEAKDFIRRVMENAEAVHEAARESRRRSAVGVHAKRAISVHPNK